MSEPGHIAACKNTSELGARSAADVGRTPKASTLLELFVTFFHLGCVTVGGMWGSATTLDATLVKKKAWLTKEELNTLMVAATVIPSPRFRLRWRRWLSTTQVAGERNDRRGHTDAWCADGAARRDIARSTHGGRSFGFDQPDGAMQCRWPDARKRASSIGKQQCERPRQNSWALDQRVGCRCHHGWGFAYCCGGGGNRDRRLRSAQRARQREDVSVETVGLVEIFLIVLFSSLFSIGGVGGMDRPDTRSLGRPWLARFRPVLVAGRTELHEPGAEMRFPRCHWLLYARRAWRVRSGGGSHSPDVYWLRWSFSCAGENATGDEIHHHAGWFRGRRRNGRRGMGARQTTRAKRL